VFSTLGSLITSKISNDIRFMEEEEEDDGMEQYGAGEK
jgi:hypothetical protein